MRLIAKLVRNGITNEVEHQSWLTRVKVGELKTNWVALRMPMHSAVRCPLPEEHVVVRLGGNLETAFLQLAIYFYKLAPPSNFVDGCVREYLDGSGFDHDPAIGR